MAAKKKKNNNSTSRTRSNGTPKSKISAQRVQKNRKKDSNKIILIAVAGMVLLGGAWLIMGSGDADNYDDLNLPSYAYNNAVTLKAYAYTVKNPVVVEKIPCYCGCGGMGHESLKNCFISDDGIYSSHASNCDICVGEVIKIKNMFESGMYISDIREAIDREYSRYGPDNGGVPITEDFNIDLLKSISSAPPAPRTVDYSNLELNSNFRGLADGLNMTPKGVIWGQFVNMKLVTGTSLESYAASRVQPPGFYGVPLVGMFAADYAKDSWIEMHDIGYIDLSVRPVIEPGMSNVIVTRPFIFGHSYNVQQTRQLMDNPKVMENAFNDYKAVLNGIDGENTGIGMVSRSPNQYSDMYYSGLSSTQNGLVQRELVYHLVAGGETLTSQYQSRAADSFSRGFTRYDVDQDNDLLTVTIIGTLDNVLAEAI